MREVFKKINLNAIVWRYEIELFNLNIISNTMKPFVLFEHIEREMERLCKSSLF